MKVCFSHTPSIYCLRVRDIVIIPYVGPVNHTRTSEYFILSCKIIHNLFSQSLYAWQLMLHCQFFFFQKHKLMLHNFYLNVELYDIIQIMLHNLQFFFQSITMLDKVILNMDLNNNNTCFKLITSGLPRISSKLYT